MGEASVTRCLNLHTSKHTSKHELMFTMKLSHQLTFQFFSENYKNKKETGSSMSAGSGFMKGGVHVKYSTIIVHNYNYSRFINFLLG